MNRYTYVKSRPIVSSDPWGLFTEDDFWCAWEHYCDGTGTSWRADFNTINWGGIDSAIQAYVGTRAGGSGCNRTSLNVSHLIPWAAEGADANVIFSHNLRLTGTIQVRCDCSWSFTGELKSDQGADLYNFNPSTHRDRWNEIKTWIGRHGCTDNSKSKPFKILLAGSRAVQLKGKNNGTPLCCD